MNNIATSIFAVILLWAYSHGAELPQGDYSVRFWNGSGKYTKLNERQKKLFIDAYSYSEEIHYEVEPDFRTYKMAIPYRYFQIMNGDRIALTVSVAIEGGSFSDYATNSNGISFLQALCGEFKCTGPEQ